MKTTMKKTLAVLLTLVMLVTLIPAPAYAYVGAMSKGASGVNASQQDGYFMLKNEYIGLYIRPGGNLTTVPSQKTLADVKAIGASEIHGFYKQTYDTSGEFKATDRNTVLRPYSSSVVIDSADLANPKLIQTLLISGFSSPVTITYEIVQLDKGAATGTTDKIIEKDGSDNGKTWGVLAKASIVNYQYPNPDLLWVTEHINFTGVGRNITGTVSLARFKTTYQQQWPYGSTTTHYTAPISSGLSRVDAVNISEAYTDSFPYANQFVAMDGYFLSSQGYEPSGTLLAGIRGHWQNYGSAVSYSPSNYSQLNVEHDYSPNSKMNALWGFRNLYSTAESVNIPPDPISIPLPATCVGIINNNGSLSAHAAANEDALKTQYGSNLIAVFRGAFNQEMGNFIFTNGAAQLTPSLTATWTEGSGGFSIAANGTVTAKGVHLCTPAFKFYKPKSGDDSSLNFSFVGGNLAIGVTPSNNDAILQIDIPGAACSVSGVLADLTGGLIFSGIMSIDTLAIDAVDISMKRLGMGWSSNTFKLEGVEASGSFDMSQLLGLEVASAEADINSFPDEERYAFALDLSIFEMFEAKGDLELKRINNGALIPNTLRLRVASDVGIPLVPPVVVAEINGIGGGFEGLANTINGNFIGIPQLVLAISAKGTVLEMIEGWYTIKIGAGYYEASLTDGKLLGMDIIDEYTWRTELGGDIRSYGGIEYKGLKVSGGMKLDLVVPNADMPFIKAGGEFNASAFCGLDNYLDPQKAYIVLSADGKIYGLVQIPASAWFINRDLVLGSAQIDAAIGGQTAFGVSNTTFKTAVKDAFGNISGYGGVAYTGSLIGWPFRIYYIFQDKSVKLKVGTWLSELEPFDPNPYSVMKRTVIDAATGVQAGLMVMNDNLKLLSTSRNSRIARNAVGPNAAVDNGVSITQSGVSENAYQVLISDAAPDTRYLAFSLVSKGASEGFLNSLTVQKTGEPSPITITAATFNSSDEITNNDIANAVDGEGTVTLKLPSNGEWTISSCTADFDISCYYAQPYASLVGMDLTGSALIGSAENMRSGTAYVLRTYLGDEAGGTDNMISQSAVPSDGAIAETLSFTGSIVPTGSYYVSTVLLEEINDDFNGDGIEESAYVTTNTYAFPTPVDYTNTEQPNPPTDVTLTAIGSELMRVKWKAPAVDPVDGYYIRLYQKDNSDWIETGANCMLKASNLTANSEGFYTYDIAVTVGDEALHLEADNTFKTGITTFRYLSDDSLPVESSEVQSDEKYLPEATFPVLTYSPVPESEMNTMKLLGINGETTITVTSDVAADIVVTRMDTQAVLGQTVGQETTLSFNTPTDFTGALNLEIRATDADGDITVDYLGLRLDETAPLITLDSDSFKADYETGTFRASGVTESCATVQVKELIAVDGTSGAELDDDEVTANENGVFEITGKLNSLDSENELSAADSVTLFLNAKDMANNESDSVFVQIVRGSKAAPSGGGSSSSAITSTIKVGGTGIISDTALRNAALAAGIGGIVKVETTGDLVSVTGKGLQYLIDQQCALQITTASGTMLIQAEVLAGLKFTENSKIEFTLAMQNGASDPELQALVEDGYPIYEVSIRIDDRKVHRLYGNITVTLDGNAVSELDGVRVIHILDNGAYQEVICTLTNGALLFKLDSLSYVYVLDEMKAAELLKNPFTDVAENDWFYDYVMYAYQTGLMLGTASDTFSPSAAITRAMAIMVLHRMNGDGEAYSSSFLDVHSGSWYGGAAAWASEKGISTGLGANIFAPDLKITREQLAVLLYRYAQFEGYNVTAYKEIDLRYYQDASRISEYAYTALQWACGAGILKGDNNGNLKPQGNANRAEVTAMLQRFVENVSE